MGAEQVFKVATEFRFDIGHALLNSEALQQSVQGISDAADQALVSFQNLGAGIVANLGLGGGGVIGLLYKAIQVTDKFQMSALGFSNVISANMEHLAGNIGTFNDRLNTSKVILGDIAKVANQFSLDESSLLQMTKLLAPVLIPHGKAGTNFSNAIDLGRNVLKASPSLGLQPGEIEGQLIRAIMGQASMHDTLFRRLLAETSAFKDLRGGSGKSNGTSKFNAMDFDKRFELIHKGLNQFASDMDVVNGVAGTLGGNMQRFKNLLGGLNSILKPLGDAILPPLLDLFHEFNMLLDTKVRQTIQTFAKALKPLLADPQNLIVGLVQLRHLSSDLGKGSTVIGITSLISLLFHLRKLAIVAPVVEAVGSFAAWLGGIAVAVFRLIPFMQIFGFILGTLWFTVTQLLVPLAAAVAFFQILSRAKALARVNDVKNLATIMPQIMDFLVRMRQALSNILLPFTMVFNAIAEFIAPLFEVTTWLNLVLEPLSLLADVLELVGKGVILAMASFQGLIFVIGQFIDNIVGGKLLHPTEGLGQAFNAGVDDFLARNAQRLGVEGGAVVNQVTNIGKVEIRNDFKEQQQPDRVAFTIKEQILKAAKNPTQGRGTGFQAAFAR